MLPLLIANPAAGKRRPEAAADRVLATLARVGVNAEPALTTHRGHAERLAREAAEAGRPMVIAVGGDGTVAEVANGLHGAPIPVCIVPAGTVNVLARDIGVPLATPEACALAAAGQPVRLDVGRADGRAFVINAGIGMDAAIVASTSLRLKRAIGRKAYVAAGVRYLARARPAVYALQAGGEEWEEELFGIIVCNTGLYAGAYRLSSACGPCDGLLDAHLLRARTRLQLGAAVLAVTLGRAEESPYVGRLQVEAISCDPHPAQPTQLDGDAWQPTPIRITVAAGSLHVMAAPQGPRHAA